MMSPSPDPPSPADRHALVCGASSGIGRAAALALARRGLRITALARRADRLEAVCGELQAAGAPRASPLVADHDDRPRLRAALAELLSAGAIHVLVNNSGGPPPGSILDATEDDFSNAFGRHVLANHLLVQLVLPGMREAGWGRIVNVISTSVREPIPGLGVSNTTRAAVSAWAKTLSRELPPGITINSILPGFTATERLDQLAENMAAGGGRSAEDVRAQWRQSIPEARLGRPEEIGEAVAFLASERASYIRGISLTVDGGRLNGFG